MIVFILPKQIKAAKTRFGYKEKISLKPILPNDSYMINPFSYVNRTKCEMFHGLLYGDIYEFTNSQKAVMFKIQFTEARQISNEVLGYYRNLKQLNRQIILLHELHKKLLLDIKRLKVIHEYHKLVLRDDKSAKEIQNILRKSEREMTFLDKKFQKHRNNKELHKILREIILSAV